MGAQLDMFAVMTPEIGFSAAAPNAYGVYPNDDAERLHIGVSKYCWATIHLLRLPTGWLHAVDYSMADRGGGGPLKAVRGHPDRAAALEAARSDLWRRTGTSADHDAVGVVKQAASLRAWLEGLA